MSKSSSSGYSASAAATATEVIALRESHQFVRDDEYDVANASKWEVRLARRYYDRLYKEFAIADLSQLGAVGGQIGVRWRTEREVIGGKGDTVCANKRCSVATRLSTYEIPFSYRENNEDKMELVKVRLCPDCSELMVCAPQCRRLGDAEETRMKRKANTEKGAFEGDHETKDKRKEKR
jgi:protein FRA10AC1